jgi:predicted transport protein
MPIFKIANDKVLQLSLKREGFGDEFKLRDFFADNLEELFGVRFLEKEYSIPDGRIDTLGIDENDSPVIIEYKWRENEEVFTQGLHYLDWLLKNKNHFELLVRDRLGGKATVSWDQPRVMLVAQGFSRYIKTAVQRVDNVELKTYALYDNNVLHIENQYTPYPERNQITRKQSISKNETIYNLEYHLNITNPQMRKYAQSLRDKILELPSVEEMNMQKSGITYRTTKSFARLEFKRTWIQLLLRDLTYVEDTQKLIRDISSHKWGYKGMIRLTPESDLEYTFALVRASYNTTL